MAGKPYDKAVLQRIDETRDELVSWIQQVVRIPSVTGNEGAMQEHMAALYRRIGLRVEQFVARREEIASHTAFIESGLPYEGRPNVIGILDGAPEAPSLTLQGHVDVVSPEPVDAWTRDPWGGDVEGGRIWGRGAADMKAGLIANAFALKTLLDLGLKPRGQVQLHSVVEEEAGGGPGALACLLKGYVTDGFIATEPHNLGLTISHGGVLYFRVKVLGRTAHAGWAHHGVNAIEKLQPIYDALVALDERRGKEIRFELYERGSGRACHLNIGTATAGDWPSTVAGWAELEGRMGFIPGETREEAMRLIEETVRAAADTDPWLRENPPVVEWFGWKADPWYQDPGHPFVQAVRGAGARVLGREVEIIGRSSGNDARFTQYFGTAGVAFGPVGGNIHGIDEWVDIDSVVATAKILALTVLDWCGVER